MAEEVDGGARAIRGTVYLVGAGPGAPDLLTLRAAQILARADIVFHDALVHPQTLALAPRARIVAVGKRSGSHSTAQRFINKRLIDAAQTYATVVRLKGGDPMLFGRAQEEIEALEVANIHFRIVPGVTAALAASAEIRTPLTVRGRVRSFALATPRSDEDADTGWADALFAADAGAVYMGLSRAAEVAAELRARGRDPSTPVAIVVDASLPTARTHHTTLEGLPQVAAQCRSGAALLLVGPQFRPREEPTRRRAKTQERFAHAV